MGNASGAGNTGNTPLFQNMDEQEQAYAPQQVPGNVLPGEELDVGGTAGQTRAASTDDQSGDQTNPQMIPVRPDASISSPYLVPNESLENTVRDDTRSSDRG